MKRARPGRVRKLVGAALFTAACSPPAPDPCPHKSGFNDAGMRCVCEDGPSGMKYEYCDPDYGNPCSIGCFNPKEADGGRQYTDAGTPVCYC